MPAINQIVKINTFDDGRQEYLKFKNEWRITKTMFNGPKLELINVKDKNDCFVFKYKFKPHRSSKDIRSNEPSKLVSKEYLIMPRFSLHSCYDASSDNLSASKSISSSNR